MTVTNLNIFQSGTLASVTPVNENFETLRIAVNTVEQSTISNRTYINNKISEVNSNLTSLKTVGEVFCINKGNLINDLATILKITENTLSFYTPFYGTNTNGDMVEVTNLSDISISGYTDGTYNVYVDLNGEIEILKGTLYRQASTPTPNVDDVWLNTSNAPLSAKRYTSNGWETFLKIPIGYFTINNGSVTSTVTYGYNQNGYRINSASLFPMPDYTKGVNKTNDVTYTAETSGWLYGYYYGARVSKIAKITIDNQELNITHVFIPDLGDGCGSGGIIPIAKGSTYKGTNFLTFMFFPAQTM